MPHEENFGNIKTGLASLAIDVMIIQIEAFYKIY